MTAKAECVNKRKLAKRQTREQLLGIGKELFSEAGYEGTSLREIARAANRTTGGIFAHFTSKAQFFAEAISADWDACERADEMLWKTESPIVDVLMGIFASDLKLQESQPKIFSDKMALWWAGEEHVSGVMRRVSNNLQAFTTSALTKAIKKGELSGEMVTGLVSEIIWNVYLGMYQGFTYSGEGALESRFRRSLEAILHGYYEHKT